MKKTRRRIAAILLATVLMWVFCPILTLNVLSAELSDSAAVLSHGVEIFAAATDMAVSSPAGNDIVFCTDDFLRAMNLSSLDYVTVRTLPPVTDGELLLGSTRVAAGQKISSGNLSYLSFCASREDVSRSSFTFSVNGSAVAICCNLYYLTSSNTVPTVSVASSLSLHPKTHVGILSCGTLSAFDPDGDPLRFEIVSYPKNGAVRLTDASAGTYVYRPDRGFSGTDRFSYVARDLYGNYSASATVELTVSASGTSVVYADLSPDDSPALYNAALTLAEEGIMSGRQVGSDHYFDPTAPVSRGEFLVLAMNAVGITQVPACADTGFADDADIPASMKGYVAAACRLGYVSGVKVGSEICFLPDSEPTRADAAVILSGIVGLCDVPVTPTFADGSAIPVWAREAIYSLHAAGILTPDVSGQISPSARLTRADTALLLAAVVQYEE